MANAARSGGCNMPLYILIHIIDPNPESFDWEIQGVFSSVEKAAAVAKPGDQILPMDLDVDYTDVFEFDITHIEGYAP